MTTTTLVEPQAASSPKQSQKLEFSTTIKAMVDVLKVLERIVPNKSTLPVLGCVLIRTELQTRLSLVANNLELAGTAEIACHVDQAGEIAVDCRHLADWLKIQEPDARLAAKLDHAHNRLTLKSGTATLQLATIPADDFPSPPQANATDGGPVSVGLPGVLLREMLGQVAFAAAPDDTRPVLSGVLLRITPETLTMAAADGFRLAVRTIDHEPEDFALNDAVSMIVPARALVELQRILEDKDDDGKGKGKEKDAEPTMLDVRWYTRFRTPTKAEASTLSFHYGPFKLDTRLIEGQFPEYQRIIPAEAQVDIQVDTKKFRRAVKACRAMARDNSSIVRLTVQPGGSLEVSGQSIELGQADDVVAYDSIGAPPTEELRAAFNGRYLDDLLAVMPDAMRLRLNSSSSPGSFRPVGLEGLLHVVMPMHVAR